MKFLFSKPVAQYNFAKLRHAISRQKIFNFFRPQESMRSTFHYPESPYWRTFADVITKISWMDSLPNYLSYGVPLARYKVVTWKSYYRKNFKMNSLIWNCLWNLLIREHYLSTCFAFICTCISWCLIRSRNGIISLNLKKNNYKFQDRADETAKNPPHGWDEKNISYPSFSNKVETF